MYGASRRSLGCAADQPRSRARNRTSDIDAMYRIAWASVAQRPNLGMIQKIAAIPAPKTATRVTQFTRAAYPIQNRFPCRATDSRFLGETPQALPLPRYTKIKLTHYPFMGAANPGRYTGLSSEHGRLPDCAGESPACRPAETAPRRRHHPSARSRTGTRLAP